MRALSLVLVAIGAVGLIAGTVWQFVPTEAFPSYKSALQAQRSCAGRDFNDEPVSVRNHVGCITEDANMRVAESSVEDSRTEWAVTAITGSLGLMTLAGLFSLLSRLRPSQADIDEGRDESVSNAVNAVARSAGQAWGRSERALESAKSAFNEGKAESAKHPPGTRDDQ